MNESSDQKERDQRQYKRQQNDSVHNNDEWGEPTAEQLLLYVEADADHWEDAARECEHAARNDSPAKAPTWHLLSAVYRERARNHRELVSRMRSRSAAA